MAFLLISLFCSIIFIFNWIEDTEFFYRMNSESFSDSRILIWSDFVDRLRGIHVIVGFDKNDSFIDHLALGHSVENIHSSYLNLYKMIGIFSIGYFFIIAYTLIKIFHVNKILFIVFISILL